MPRVGDKEYPYTKKGMAAARKAKSAKESAKGSLRTAKALKSKSGDGNGAKVRSSMKSVAKKLTPRKKSAPRRGSYR